MEVALRKTLFKIEVYVLKVLLAIIALLCFLNTVLSYFYYDTICFSYIAGVGVLPLLFIIYVSITHGFCLYHRLFAYYIGVNNIICFIDYKYELPISNRDYLLLHIIVAFIFLSAIVYLKIKHGKRIKESYNKSY